MNILIYENFTKQIVYIINKFKPIHRFLIHPSLSFILKGELIHSPKRVNGKVKRVINPSNGE
jgi:hypothetical protein